MSPGTRASFRRIAVSLHDLREALATVPTGEDAFIGFLYAGAASITIGHFVTASSRPDLLEGVVGVLLILLFLASDWSSHYRIKIQLPVELRFKSSVMKLFLELMTVYFLTMSIVRLIDLHPSVIHTASSVTNNLAADAQSEQSTLYWLYDRQITLATYFGLFAVTSWLWNLLIFWKLKRLSWVKLVVATLRGKADEQQPCSRRFCDCVTGSSLYS